MTRLWSFLICLPLLAGPAHAQQFGPWEVICPETGAGSFCDVEQALADDGSTLVVKATRIGLSVELLLHPERGSLRSATALSRGRPFESFAAHQIIYLGDVAGLRRYRLTDVALTETLLSRMLRSESMGFDLDYAGDRQETLSFDPANLRQALTFVHERVPF